MSDPRQSPHESEEARRREANESLVRLHHEGDVIGRSALAQTALRMFDHFAARDATGEGGADQAEIWGRRIGRVLSLLALVGLCFYLYATYLR
ncbi:MAG TPA: hypothetical protein VHN11_14105 [Xanthobacteraceae bacterium]|jgi:hypothetical protein|nr:hypothetical protein [Xanthobacteraceae bacterium]